MRSRTKKLVSMLCVAAMLVSALPVAAFAAEEDTADVALSDSYTIGSDTQIKDIEAIGPLQAPVLQAAMPEARATAGMYAGGWFETLYAEITGVSDADVTAVSYSGTMAGSLMGEDFEYLVRNGSNGVRIDIPGLPAGTYDLTVTAKGQEYKAENIEVMEYDRSGYAHYKYTEGVGAYRDDGILKENAIVLYVTEANKNTVELEAPDGTIVTGIGNILNTAGMEDPSHPGQCKRTSDGKTYYGKANSNQGILKKLAEADIPLVVRIVDSVKSTHPAPASGGIDGLTAFNSWDYGGTYKSGDGDNGNMARMKDARNVTIEGIGSNATMDGWGIHFMAGTDFQKGGKSFEVRNIAFRNVPEDCVGIEGVQEGGKITAGADHTWVHNCAFYAPTGLSPAAASDKSEGDGACDFKRGEYHTMSYCYYDGYHKTNLVGSADSSLQYHITWHHNYWKNCQSRGPLGRQANMHIYNCIYEGQSDYAMNPRANCYIFSEYNTFINCKNPVQVKAGGVKSYNDTFTGCQGDMDATIVTDKSQTVSTANLYANFDTNASISYIPSGDYKLDKDPAVAMANIKAYAGPMKAQVISADDVDTSVVDPAVKPTTPITLPLTVSFSKSYDGKADNVVVRKNGSGTATTLKLSGSTTGQDIMFLVDEAVDITVTDGGSSNPIELVNENGVSLLTGSGTVKNLPAGIYMLQSSLYDGGTGKYKDAAISGLYVEKTTVTNPHVHSFTGWKQTVAPTCTRTGTEVGTCSCGETETREIAKLDHDYEGGACSMCGLMEGTLSGGSTTPGETVNVTGLTVDQTEVTLMQGDTLRIIATVTPANATNKAVTWTSDDTTVATVAKNGTITAKGPGATTVTASAGNGAFTKTVTVSVIGVQTDTYTFAAATHGPSAVQDTSKGEDPVADGSKWGTGNYFTNSGAKNVWKAQDVKNNKMNVAALLLATGEGSSLDFTVPEGSTAEVTLNYRSTSSTNASAIAIRKAGGELVNNTEGKRLDVCIGNATTSVTYKLGAGTYQILAPKGVEPDEVDPDKTAFNTDGKDNPNNRGAQLIGVTVVESKPVGGDIVAVESVTLDKTSGTIEVGHVLALSATVAPANATIKNVTWTSSNGSIATVSNGMVTGRGVGTAVITATCGGKSATCAVTVTASTSEVVKVTGITISGPSAVGVQDSIQLTAVVTPEDATDDSVTWTTSNAKLATVNSRGMVEGVADGKVTITATANDGSGVKATKQITVGTGANKDALNAAITAAEKAAGNVKVAESAAEVAKGSKWVTEADMDAFTAAIDAAQKVADKSSATQAEADAAVETLNAALTTFMGKRQNGTKETGGTTPTPSTSKVLEAKNLTAFAQGEKADGANEEKNGFTIYYSTKSKVDTTGATFDDEYAAVQRMNFGGKLDTKVPKNGIKFTTTGAATVKVWWVQSGDNKVQVAIADTTGKEITKTAVADAENTKNSPHISTLSVTDGGTYFMGGDTNNVYICKVELTETASGGDEPTPDQANKTALNSAITAAKANLNAATVSEDGSDVATTAKWVTQADKTAYNMAIITAELVADDANATQAEVDAAVADLAAATAKFEAAKVDGTKSEGGNTPTPPGPSGDGGSGGGGSTTTKKPAEATPGDDTFLTVDSATRDNVAVAELTDKQMSALTSNAVKNNSANVVVTVNALNSVGTTRVNVSANALDNMADKTDAALTVQTPTGDVKLPAASVADLGSNSGKTISVLIAKTDDGVKLTVAAGNKILDKVAGGVTAITEAGGSGSVAYLIAADGSEKLLKKSYVEAGKLHANLPGSGEIVLKDNAKTFRDTEDNWAKDAIGFAASRELFNGVNELDFAPNQEMTRAMLVTVLYRLEGAVSTGKSSFKDVSADSWYADAVAWGNDQGIVSGKLEGYFGPDDNITREQLATILYRYATKLCGMGEVSGSSKALEKFSDAAVVSGYAEDGMKWAVQQGIIGGRGDGTLAPSGFASRAEVATMLMRFVKAIV